MALCTALSPARMAFKFGYSDWARRFWWPLLAVTERLQKSNFSVELALCFGSDFAVALQGAIEVVDDLAWGAKTWEFKKDSGWRLQRETGPRPRSRKACT